MERDYRPTVLDVTEVTNEMMIWLCDNPIFRTWHISPWFVSPTDKGNKIFFDYAEDATAFKLRFPCIM